MRPMERYF